MLQKSLESQRRFKDLELELRQMKELQQSGLAGSFSAFQTWLEKNHPQIMEKAKTIALDVRLWRDTQDVLRQLWDRVYRL